jgi:hypothetical protein
VSRIKRANPAIVIAIVALCVAVVGTAAAGPIAEISLTKHEKKQTRKIAATLARKIAARVSNRRITKRAPKLSVASANSAAAAATASNATSLGGVGASAYVQRSELAPVPLTTLTLNPGWAQILPGSPLSGPPTAYRDQVGAVHLSGLIQRTSGTESTALTLPPGLRPGHGLELMAVCDEPGLSFDPRPGIVFIEPGGRVDPLSSPSYSCTERLSLDGITFRAES